MSRVPLSFFFHWQNLQENMYPNVMREFHDNGVRNLVLTEYLLSRIIKEPTLLMTSKTLLRDTDLQIVQIMAQCGFQNQSSFNRVFRKQCGVSPKQYRNESRK